jgi:hypothetical protein
MVWKTENFGETDRQLQTTQIKGSMITLEEKPVTP